MDLKDSEIAKEFWSKKSNKSSTQGGLVRPLPKESNGQHFEEGIFVFNKRVLNWTLEMIKKPFRNSVNKPLPDRYTSRDKYYESFEELIFEEVRAILQTGIEQAAEKNQPELKLKLIKCQRANNPENPIEMKFNPSGSYEEIKAGDALLLEHATNHHIKLIALSNYSESTAGDPQISVKVVIDNDLINMYGDAFKEGQQWTATAIGSLITLQRMFDACTTFKKRAETFLEKSIWKGRLGSHSVDNAHTKKVRLRQNRYYSEYQINHDKPLRKTALKPSPFYSSEEEELYASEEEKIDTSTEYDAFNTEEDDENNGSSSSDYTYHSSSSASNTGGALYNFFTKSGIDIINYSSAEAQDNDTDEEAQHNDTELLTLSNEQELLAKLNPSQSEAIGQFLQLEKGMHLIQGPPGTGKTTTVIQLLKILQERGERLLVCAPSNKAVQVIGEGFITQYPNIPIAFLGVEEKLPSTSPLCKVFVDTWETQKVDSIQEMNALLWELQPSKLVQDDDKFIKNRIMEACKKLECIKIIFSEFVNEAALYQLSFLEDLKKAEHTILKTIGHYCELMPFVKSECWEEVRAYNQEVLIQKRNKNQDEPIEIPELINVIRSILSPLAMALQSVESTLKMLNADSSTKGLKGQLIDHSAIVFATLSTCGQQRLKEMKPVDSLIIDEAGQAVEAETIIPLRFNPKKCLLIGDIKQLPATVISPYAENLKFGRSLMERLISDCEQPSSMLEIQYRMHPHICEWPSKKYYGGRLKNHESVCEYKPIIPKAKNTPPFLLSPYAFINIEGNETAGPYGHSFINKSEAYGVKLIVEYLHQQRINVIHRVGIITFYKGQSDYIRNDLDTNFSGIKVNTVDGFQGGENDIIIISCVRANLKKQIGFLNESRRLNVALTRARFSLIILGHQKTLARSDIAELVTDAHQRHLLFPENELLALIPKKIEKAKTKFSQNKSLQPPPKKITGQAQKAQSARNAPPVIRSTQKTSAHRQL